MTERPAPEDVWLYRLVRSHGFISQRGAYGSEGCMCGWKRDGWDAPTHEQHVAAALAPVLAQREAEAVRAALAKLEL